MREQAVNQYIMQMLSLVNDNKNSKYDKEIEQLKFRSVSHGDLMFRKLIIKHLLKRFGI